MSIRDYNRRLFCNIKWCGLRCNLAAYIVLRILGYLRVSCLPSTIILPSSVCLPICLLCSCDCLCKRTAHAQIQEFCQGGGSRPDCQKTILMCVFLVLNLFYSFYRGCTMVISKKTIIFHGFRMGGNICQGGLRGGGGGGQMLISIETHITCVFPGGPDPLSPLWIRTCN